MKSIITKKELLFLIILVWGKPLFAQSSIEVEKLKSPVNFDGKVEEEIWNTLDPLDFIMYEPQYGGDMSEQTDVWLAHDGEYLIIAAKLYDSQPDLIRANSITRDQSNGNDHLEILIDTFNDNENAVVFKTIPTGIRVDGSITNDAAGQDWISTDFNTFWDVRTSIGDYGWSAEIRIPFSSLRFEPVDGKVTMGISIWRSIARKNEVHVFPATPPISNRAYIKPSLAQDMVIENVSNSNPIYVTPYLLGGFEQFYEINQVEEEVRNDSYTGDVGLDVKYGLSPTTTLDLTFNTDFAQVEADNQQINLTRFPLFFPEKRPFFLERAGIFEFSLGGPSQLFYSRRIGLSDGGQAVPIIAGTRVVGRYGDLDVGFLNMQTARSGDIPSENFGILRLKKRLFNEFSSAGLMFTNRVNEKGTYNTAYGLDGTFRVSGDEYGIVKWAQNFENDQPIDLSTGLLSLIWERRTREGFFYNGGITWSGENFNPGVGFTLRENFTQVFGNVYYGEFKSAESNINWIRYALESRLYIRNIDNEIETFETGLHYWRIKKDGDDFWFDPTLTYENLMSGFSLSDDVEVLSGTYIFPQVRFGYEIGERSLVRGILEFKMGKYFDGNQFTTTVIPRWVISSAFEIGGSYDYSYITFPDRDQSLNAHIPRFRINLAFNKYVSSASFVQYSSVSKNLGGNIRLRYNFKEGSDLWIVFNQNINTNHRNSLTPLPHVQNRTLLLKLTYTFY